MTNGIDEAVFAFDQNLHHAQPIPPEHKDASPPLPVHPTVFAPAPSPADPQQTHLEDMCRAVEAVDLVTYHWDIASDHIRCSANAPTVLNCQAELLSAGRSYATLLDGENLTSRYETVMRSHDRDSGSGVPFHIEYLLRPEGRSNISALWVEDQGRWFAGPDGTPAQVFGTLRRIDERHAREQQLNFVGNYDPLTGLMNRGKLAEALSETITGSQREKTPCAFLIAAVNNLSIVNEAYGFEVADDVIAALSRRLRHVVRTGDAIARYSGSKFGIILNNCSDEDLSIAIERFKNIARESVIETERGPVWAMLSIGAVILPLHADTSSLAMARAEEALSEAKRLPSDGGVIYKPSPQLTAERNLNARCATEIVKCLKEDQFKLAFQPIVDAQSHELLMHEGLLRMIDPAGEMIAAAHLIPVAEKLGLVRLIDRKVAHIAIAHLHDYPLSRLTMNVSGATATDPRWAEQLTEIIAANTQVADRLTVEITETVALGNIKQTVAFIEALRAQGCSVAIDDFGAGFTSFRNLRDLPVNIIKLDGSFCRDVNRNSANQYLVRTLTELGHKFNLKVVGEWVESADDAQMMAACGVDYLQGNYFGAASLELPWRKSGYSAFEGLSQPDRPQLVFSEISDPHSDSESEPSAIATDEPQGVREPVDTTVAEAARKDAVLNPEPVTEPLPDDTHQRGGEDQELAETDASDDDSQPRLSRLRAVLAELEAFFPQPQAEIQRTA